jgi:hypothetical protein
MVLWKFLIKVEIHEKEKFNSFQNHQKYIASQLQTSEA